MGRTLLTECCSQEYPAFNPKLVCRDTGKVEHEGRNFSRRIPLSDEPHIISTALTFLYKGSSLLTSSKLHLEVLPDNSDVVTACNLVRFAHKYALEPLLQQAEEHLTNRFQRLDITNQSFTDVVLECMSMAERCNLTSILASCELHVIRNFSLYDQRYEYLRPKSVGPACVA